MLYKKCAQSNWWIQYFNWTETINYNNKKINSHERKLCIISLFTVRWINIPEKSLTPVNKDFYENPWIICYIKTFQESFRSLFKRKTIVRFRFDSRNDGNLNVLIFCSHKKKKFIMLIKEEVVKIDRLFLCNCRWSISCVWFMILVGLPYFKTVGIRFAIFMIEIF